MRPQARSGTGRLDPRSFLSLPWIVSQRGAVAAPVLTKTLTAKNQRGGVQQPVRHRPSAVGNEPKRNARRPCMITQRLGAEEGDTPVDQQPAAMQDFDPTYDRCGSDSVIRRCLHNVRFTPESGHPICALIANRCRSPCQNCTDLHVGPFLTARGRHFARVQLCRDPRTVTLEAISEWRKAVEETVSLREAHRCLKIWRALWKVSAAMHYCKRDDDPSLGVRNRAAPGRNLQWTEGEVVRVAKRAWRLGYFGLAAVIATAWDTQLNPGDVRALRASQLARSAAGEAFFTERGKTGKPVGGILSMRTLRVLSAYL